MFAVEKTGELMSSSRHFPGLIVIPLGVLTLIWQKDMSDNNALSGVIPRSIAFIRKGENLVIFSLEAGSM